MADSTGVAATLDLLRNHSLTSVVYRAIEQMILQSELLPGQHVNENAIAGQLSVSRGPVREALRALEQAGLVKQVARRGVFVQEVSLREAIDAYDVRASLFGTAGKLLAERIADNQLESLAGVADDMDRARAAEDSQAYYGLNLQFHGLLVEYSGNQELARIYQALVKKLHLFRRRALVGRGGLDASAREHRRILKALGRRDAAEARRLMEGHVLAGKLRFLKADRDRRGAGEEGGET
jgi:DNA-binding GntR family transcriptional regulator